MYEEDPPPEDGKGLFEFNRGMNKQGFYQRAFDLLQQQGEVEEEEDVDVEEEEEEEEEIGEFRPTAFSDEEDNVPQPPPARSGGHSSSGRRRRASDNTQPARAPAPLFDGYEPDP